MMHTTKCGGLGLLAGVALALWSSSAVVVDAKKTTTTLSYSGPRGRNNSVRSRQQGHNQQRRELSSIEWLITQKIAAEEDAAQVTAQSNDDDDGNDDDNGNRAGMGMGMMGSMKGDRPTPPPTDPPNCPQEPPTPSPVTTTTGAPTETPAIEETAAPTEGLTPSPTAVASSASPTESENSPAPSVQGTTATPTAPPSTPAPEPTPSPIELTDFPTATPTIAPTTSAPALSLETVVLDDFFIAYVIPSLGREPTPAEYAALFNATLEYFEACLTFEFANPTNIVKLVDLTAARGDDVYNFGIPVDRFNLYAEYDALTLSYVSGFVGPDADETFALLQDCITEEYILDVVRVLNPFQTTNEVIMRKVGDINVETSPPTTGPTNPPGVTDAPTPVATTIVPTIAPTKSPTSIEETDAPVAGPTATPTGVPTPVAATDAPTPTETTLAPTPAETTIVPTSLAPSLVPSLSATTRSPVLSGVPSLAPTSISPTLPPSAIPTSTAPTTTPTLAPTPSAGPTSIAETEEPSISPSTAVPSVTPTATLISDAPSSVPTVTATTISPAPTALPTADETTTLAPVVVLTPIPTTLPVPESESPSAVPTTTPESAAPTSAAPTVLQTVVSGSVTVDPFFIAFAAPDADREPTIQEYASLVTLTVNYFNTYFTDLFANDATIQFLGVSAFLGESLFNLGFPEPQYNIYVTIDGTEFTYEPGFLGPDGNATFELILESATADYIAQVNSLTGTPFESTAEVTLGIAGPVPTPAPTIFTTNAPTITAAPTFNGTFPPTPTPVDVGETVTLDSFFIAYVAPGADREPTIQEYGRLVTASVEFFNSYFRDLYAEDPGILFVGITSFLGESLFNAGNPEARFNLYVTFDGCEFSYEPGSVVPDASEIFVQLQTGIDADYILRIQSALAGTPFATTREVVVAAV